MASPLDLLADLRLGSRPSRRSGAESGRSLDDLRAIPWVFAWSMTRVNLPGWYGLGSGLEALDDVALAREAYREWPVFAALVDVAEMSLAKTDDRLAERFLALGARPELAAAGARRAGPHPAGGAAAARPGGDARSASPTCTRRCGCGGRSSTCSATCSCAG